MTVSFDPFPRSVPGLVPQRRGCPLSDLRDKLRRVGLRPTRQRVSLGWLLFGKGDRHITAEMLFDEASRARVPVSLATVYNTLHRSEEHTSELQSRQYLVCRLLLEKKRQ